jgi:hypothetical protein
METGVQGGGESTDTTQQKNDGGEQTTESRLLSEFENFRNDVSSQLGELRSYVEPEDDEDDPDADYEDDGYQDPDGYTDPDLQADDFDDDGQINPEAAQRALDQMMEQKFASMIEPHVRATQQMQEAQKERERASYADHLEATYPQLSDPDLVNEMLEKTAAQAHYLAERKGLGPAEARDLAEDPEFFEMVFLAEQARNGMGAAGAAGQQDVTLETGGAAGPTAPEWDEKKVAQGIVNAGGRKFRLGS